MGRSPCCDKFGVKKGPWTPEEDIVLVSYIQKHGPGNWRAIPAYTGLLRCSKSCRLRWTNYLRPGIKRGKFTEQEEEKIIHLQALLGNRWAAIASYMPQRTDNDIKNYWNTHLKKKLNRLHTGGLYQWYNDGEDQYSRSSDSNSMSKGQWERALQTDINMAKQALCRALSLDEHSLSSDSSKGIKVHNISNRSCPTSTYASSADNIAKLLQGWMKNSPNSIELQPSEIRDSFNSFNFSGSSSSDGATSGRSSDQCFNSTIRDDILNSNTLQSDENMIFTWEGGSLQDESRSTPFKLIEKWLFDDGPAQGQDDLMELPLDDEAAFF